MWMYCSVCHHLFARSFPEQLQDQDKTPSSPDPGLFPHYSDILTRLREFESDRLWDIFIMDDVLGHMSDPDDALAKAESMLNDEGALWISTPTFDSDDSSVTEQNDVMSQQQSLINFFSKESLYMLLARYHLVPIDFRLTGQQKEMMEVIVIKEGRA